MTTPRRRVLVVDDQADQLETLCRGLFLLGVDCLRARDAAQALAHLEREPVDLLLCDLTRPATSGSRLIERARAARPSLSVLAIAGLALSPETIALRARGLAILRKPFTADELGRAVEALVPVRPCPPTEKGELE